MGVEQSPSYLSDKLIAELLLELKKLNAAIAGLQKPASGVLEQQWAIGSSAWEYLKAEGVRSASHLKQLRRDGVFSEHKGEIRNVSRGARPAWEYNIPLCRTALKEYLNRLSS